MNPYEFMIARLNGGNIQTSFTQYLGLVRKGIAGFIVFGGELLPLREGLARLQAEARLPLIVASDLEQGLGQQVKGGTLFPPAMAIGEASLKDMALPRLAFGQMAEEAAYAGINTILAPVLDINTNPDNPIIATRAFGESPERVSTLAAEMIEAFRLEGIKSCGKHFPGHGDTAIDSHISLPRLDKPLKELERTELRPFRDAVRAGVDMMMLGHLSCPALDPRGLPASLSPGSISYLKEQLGFGGLIITDAMNMGGLGGFGEGEAALAALRAGVDVILHPEDPDRLASALDSDIRQFDPEKVESFRKSLGKTPSDSVPAFDESVSERISREAVRVEGSVRPLNNPMVVVLSDDEDGAAGEAFASALAKKHPSVDRIALNSSGDIRLPAGREVIVAVFSSVRAWKGGTAHWIFQALKELEPRAVVFVSFGSPYILGGIEKGKARVYAWWCGEAAQRAAAEIIMASGG